MEGMRAPHTSTSRKLPPSKTHTQSSRGARMEGVQRLEKGKKQEEKEDKDEGEETK